MIGNPPKADIREGNEIIGQRDEFVKCSEIAKDVHVSANTIKRALLEGRIRPIRFGRDHTGTIMAHKDDVVRIHNHYQAVRSIK